MVHESLTHHTPIARDSFPLPSQIPTDEDSKWILQPCADLLEAQLPPIPESDSAVEGDAAAFMWLRRWLALEGNRVLYYKWLDHALKLYIEDPTSHRQYAMVTSLIAQGLASIREDGSNVREGLKQCGKEDLERMVAAVEKLEVTKLKSIARYQVARSQSVCGVQDFSSECDELQKSLSSLTEKVNTSVEDVRAEMADLSSA
ncbi:hypothetical protein M427DRAFT_71913 [Gonapodya prolifera JEL478]|uniref:Uncharacterized protein n=1 Tax=Gonapodya prolifera (strain JEL478) TaxID=1344416 RepID=A0A139A734_GONPJ|nr:hypothetical protein M427DRAFT_71913 [Gonapodya prolifera JEL478]|eukprot:KXS12610.1 hypothetical protein M427DRAFT_71913 [Gonapodya prolifera JEL478]